MLRKGFVEIQIEMLAMALTKILFFKSKGDYVSAAAEIKQASQKIIGLDTSFFARQTEDSLLACLTVAGRLDAGKCWIVARLMQEQADICDAQEQPAAACSLRQKSLFLFLTALEQEPSLHSAACVSSVQALLMQTDTASLSLAGRNALFRFHEAQGQFAQAENVLYTLGEAQEAHWHNLASAFYDRLLLISDESLTAGGVSREEIEESLNDITLS